jgi:hypothetical protein
MPWMFEKVGAGASKNPLGITTNCSLFSANEPPFLRYPLLAEFFASAILNPAFRRKIPDAFTGIRSINCALVKILIPPRGYTRVVM